MGITGSPVAALSFDSVRVTSDQRLVSPYGHWRDTFMIEPTSALGRMLTVVSATSSLSKKSLKYMAQFRMKREINGKPLGEYGKIQALIAKSTAEVFALDSVIQWSLAGSDGDNLPNRWWEQTATKNIVTLAASRLADRAISFMGASGYEKAAVYPTEKLYRDARGFRISGGVDFMIDLQAAQRWLKAFFYNDEFDRKKWMDQFEVKKRLNIDDSVLGPECTRILNRIRTDARDLGELIQQLISKHSYEELCKQQSLLILMNRVANEIFTIAATLARARKRAIDSETFAISIAEEYAAEGLLKINGFWEKIRLEVAMSGPVQQRRVSIGHYLDGHMLDFCL